MLKFMGTLLLSLIIVSCSSQYKREKVKSSEAPILSEEDAEHRASKVSEVEYDLFFDISKKKEFYTGVNKILFKLSSKSSDLRIDFGKGSVRKTIVNGQKVKDIYNQHYLLIPKQYLKSGLNEVEIHFTQTFSRDGSGYYRFVDPEDNKIYTYTDLEPYDANKVFPCFDQPNLKATYKMYVKAPTDWHVVTSTLPKKVTTKKNYKIWHFKKSALFSTYIWSLHAGPYHVYTDKSAKYPSRLFVRDSLKKYVKVDDWFTFTRQSFEFLNEYFGYEYPYLKYDQLIVPDFNAGAMENVASVTFTERFVSRGEKSQKARRRLANVIFHEMAHMWFGNLVTMDWWNDLWLNESFATYMANLGVATNTEFKNEAWRDFNGTKSWAYWEDQLVTTHPIVANVPDTSQAFANFDGITYGKGASSLKQIHYFLGDEAFKSGLQIYFKKHANKNTKLKDFMGALEAGSKRSLKNWQKKWLQTTGVNTIKTNFQCVEGKITSFEISQSAPNSVIRPHAFEVAFLNLKNKKMSVSSVHKVELTEKSKKLETLKGLDCPEIVYPNYNDHDYIMVELDKMSLENLTQNLKNIESAFLRQLLWSTLFDMVYYGQYSYKDYAELAIEHGLKTEQDDIVLRNLLTSIHGRGSTSSSLMYYASKDPSMSKLVYSEFTKEFEKLIWQRLIKAKAGSEIQKVLFDSFVQTAQSTYYLNKLQDLYTNRSSILGLEIDQDKRWSILVTLTKYNFPRADIYVKNEKARDTSSLGKKMSITCEALASDMQSKQKWIEEFKKKDSSYSFSELKSAIYSLFPNNHSEQRQLYAKDFFKDMKWINDNKEDMAASAFARLAPLECSGQGESQIEKFLGNTKNLNASVKKRLKIINQENERCAKVIEIAQKK